MSTLLEHERVETLGSGLSCLISPDHGFGTDALLLADFADPKRNAPCMDLGTGCGIIPLLWKRNGVTADIYGLELQEKGYDQFRRSIELCAEQGVPMDNIHALCGDLRDLSPLDLPLGTFKTVTMNPPYKPVDTGILSETAAEQRTSAGTFPSVTVRNGFRTFWRRFGPIPSSRSACGSFRKTPAHRPGSSSWRAARAESPS